MIICAIETPKEFKAIQTVITTGALNIPGLPIAEEIGDTLDVAYINAKAYRDMIDMHTVMLNMIACKDDYSDGAPLDESLTKYLNENILSHELIQKLDWKNIDSVGARFLGFRQFDEDDSNLWLIPRYLLPAIPIGLEVETITGEIIVNDGSNIDKDTRGGLLGYGIRVKD